MPIRFAFHHIDQSAALCNYTEEKLRQTVRKFTRKPVNIHVTFSKSKRKQIAHCDLFGAYGVDLHAEVRDESAYGAVNKMTEKLARQLKRNKERVKKHKIHVASRRRARRAAMEHHNLLYAEDALVPITA